MQPDPSPFDSLVVGFLRFWPQIGMALGPVLIIAGRFRWRLVCESAGVIILGISIGAIASRV
jgi:hypothetical protein